jgi:hypothetical protein
VLFALFLGSTAFAAQESHELTLANLYYDNDDYAGAYTHFQTVILRDGGPGLSGDTLYRYADTYEHLRGLDATARGIYALSLYYFQQEEQSDSSYARHAAGKLKGASPPPDDTAAAALLEELRAGIEGERKARFYRGVDRLYGFFSRFSLFQWKIIASLGLSIPLFIGLGLMVLTKKKST